MYEMQGYTGSLIHTSSLMSTPYFEDAWNGFVKKSSAAPSARVISKLKFRISEICTISSTTPRVPTVLNCPKMENRDHPPGRFAKALKEQRIAKFGRSPMQMRFVNPRGRKSAISELAPDVFFSFFRRFGRLENEPFIKSAHAPKSDARTLFRFCFCLFLRTVT